MSNAEECVFVPGEGDTNKAKPKTISEALPDSQSF